MRLSHLLIPLHPPNPLPQHRLAVVVDQHARGVGQRLRNKKA